MGTCCGNNIEHPDEKGEVQTDKRVTKEIEKDKKKNEHKILFLGPGGCGKSTIFKQLRTIYGEEFTDNERILYRDDIFIFVMETIQSLIHEIDIEDLSDDAQQSAQYIRDLDPRVQINEKIASHIKLLWTEKTIKDIFDIQSQTKLDQACAHFFENIDRISKENFIPTNRDILLQRRPTTGLIEQTFVINNKVYKLFDVGGQRNERRKWEHCFENVSKVIFVASLTSYDQPMFEDETKNAMEDSIELFEEICKSQWFAKEDMILFLNKKDLFEKKLKEGISLKKCPKFEDYDEPENKENIDAVEAINYIQSKFDFAFNNAKNVLRKSTVTQIQKNADKRQLYVKITCAYDSQDLKQEFDRVVEILG